GRLGDDEPSAGPFFLEAAHGSQGFNQAGEHGNPKSEARNPKQTPNPKSQGPKPGRFLFGILYLGPWDLFRISCFGFRVLPNGTRDRPGAAPSASCGVSDAARGNGAGCPGRKSRRSGPTPGPGSA